MEQKEPECQNCKRPVTKEEVAKTLLKLPCLDSICLKCYQKDVKPEGPQDIFQCPVCGMSNSLDYELKTLAIKLIDESSETYKIFCYKHTNKIAKYFCLDHHDFMCVACYDLGSHIGHKLTKIS